MEKEKHPKGKTVLLAAAVSGTAYLLLLALCAYLTLGGWLGEGRMEGTVRLCAAMAAFVGAAFSARSRKGNGALTVLLSTAIFCAAFLLAGALLWREVDGAAAASLLLAAFVGALPALALRRRGGRRGRRRGSTHSRRST